MVRWIKSLSLRSPEHVVLATALMAWAAGLSLILSHPIFVTNDSLSNYGHVWYVADVFWHGGGIPFHFPEIGHGDALAFPYGFLPWFSAALVRPILGDWGTTLWLVLGGLGVLAGTFWAFPELRKPLPATLLLVNPLMVESVILGQLPFLWATALLFFGIGCWRRGWRWRAILLVGLAQAGHPAVVLPLAGLLVVGCFAFETDKRSYLLSYLATLIVAAPATWLVLISPVVEDSSTSSLFANFVGTVSLRAGVVAAPFVALLLLRKWGAGWLWGAVALASLLNVVLVPIRDTSYGWGALVRGPNEQLAPFLESPEFQPGATYRLLRVADGKVGMYRLIQHGGRLDSEFFPESISRRSWPSLEAYREFLHGRHVDYVVIYRAYDARYATNEHDLLNRMVSGGCAVQSTAFEQFELYQIVGRCP
ncbi:MAG: hypothetical protein ABI939_02950 [Anaerolineaceae bacterium]